MSNRESSYDHFEESERSQEFVRLVSQEEYNQEERSNEENRQMGAGEKKGEIFEDEDEEECQRSQYSHKQDFEEDKKKKKEQLSTTLNNLPSKNKIEGFPLLELNLGEQINKDFFSSNEQYVAPSPKLKEYTNSNFLSATYSQFEYFTEYSVSSLDFSSVYPYQIGFGMCNFQPLINQRRMYGQREAEKMVDIVRLDWSDFEDDYRRELSEHSKNIKEDEEIINYAAPKIEPNFGDTKNFKKMFIVPESPMITEIKYAPKSAKLLENTLDMFATSGTCLNIYAISENPNQALFPEIEPYETRHIYKLQNKNNEYNLPICSFDWHGDTICSVSLDSSLSVWDLNLFVKKEQILAHESQCFDVKYHPSGQKMLTGGADGCVKLFDPKNITQSTVVYRSKKNLPIQKIEWLQNDRAFNFAVAELYNENVKVFDLRRYDTPIYELIGHQKQVTCMKWSPAGDNKLCTGGDDGRLFFWDFIHNPHQPSQSIEANYPILNMSWCKLDQEWIAVSLQKKITMFRL